MVGGIPVAAAAELPDVAVSLPWALLEAHHMPVALRRPPPPPSVAEGQRLRHRNPVGGQGWAIMEIIIVVVFRRCPHFSPT